MAYKALGREAGCRRYRAVRFRLNAQLPAGLNRQSARRGLRQLAGAGLVEVHRYLAKGWK